MSKITIEKYKRSYSVNVPFELKDELKRKFNAVWIPELKRWKIGPSKLQTLELWIEEHQEQAVALFEAARILKEHVEAEQALPVNTSPVKSIRIGRTDIKESRLATARWCDDEIEEVYMTLKCVVGMAYIELEDGQKLQVEVKRPLQNRHYDAKTFTFNYERGVVNHDLDRLKNEVIEVFEKRVAKLVSKWNQPRANRGWY